VDETPRIRPRKALPSRRGGSEELPRVRGGKSVSDRTYIRLNYGKECVLEAIYARVHVLMCALVRTETFAPLPVLFSSFSHYSEPGREMKINWKRPVCRNAHLGKLRSFPRGPTQSLGSNPNPERGYRFSPHPNSASSHTPQPIHSDQLNLHSTSHLQVTYRVPHRLQTIQRSELGNSVQPSPQPNC
jgi:hypothetical protein